MNTVKQLICDNFPGSRSTNTFGACTEIKGDRTEFPQQPDPRLVFPCKALHVERSFMESFRFMRPHLRDAASELKQNSHADRQVQPSYTGQNT